MYECYILKNTYIYIYICIYVPTAVPNASCASPTAYIFSGHLPRAMDNKLTLKITDASAALLKFDTQSRNLNLTGFAK